MTYLEKACSGYGITEEEALATCPGVIFGMSRHITICWDECPNHNVLITSDACRETCQVNCDRCWGREYTGVDGITV